MNKKEKVIQIYDALCDLLEEKPTIDKISLSDIANKLDIGKSTIYEYFESKEALVLNAIKYYTEIFLDEIRNIKLIDFEVCSKEYLFAFYKFQKKAKKICLSLYTNIFFENESIKDNYKLQNLKTRDIAHDIGIKIMNLGFEQKIINKTTISAFDMVFIETMVVQMINVFELKQEFLNMDLKNYFEHLYKMILYVLQ